MVVPVDPAGGGVFDVGDALVGPGVEDGGADAFGLEQPDDALHQTVVVGVADRPDRGCDAFKGEMVGEPDRGVLTGLNRWTQHRLVGWTLTVRPVPRRVSSIRVSCVPAV